MGQLELRGSAVVTSGEVARGEDASRIALTLTEPASSAARWRIRLDAELSDGSRGTVGTLTTRTPTASGGVSARVIGSASCPGAVAWHVVVEQIDAAGAAAKAVLGAAVCPGPAERAGVLANRPHATDCTYEIIAGTAGNVAVPVGARIVAVTAVVAAGAVVDGTVIIGALSTIQVPPGTSITVEPDEDVMGQVLVQFANTDAYVIETVR
jgi:hypothetical protein